MPAPVPTKGIPEALLAHNTDRTKKGLAYKVKPDSGTTATAYGLPKAQLFSTEVNTGKIQERREAAASPSADGSR